VAGRESPGCHTDRAEHFILPPRLAVTAEVRARQEEAVSSAVSHPAAASMTYIRVIKSRHRGPRTVVVADARAPFELNPGLRCGTWNTCDLLDIFQEPHWRCHSQVGFESERPRPSGFCRAMYANSKRFVKRSPRTSGRLNFRGAYAWGNIVSSRGYHRFDCRGILPKTRPISY
jgi:hypothetical protein